jgi:hypothetical protein
MSNLIWYDLFDELNTYFQANNLSAYNGYVVKPQTVDSTLYPFYYFDRVGTTEIDIFDLDNTHVVEENEPKITFNIRVGTVSPDSTDTSLESANLEHFTVEKAIRTELYNYRYNSGTDLSKCLYAATINNIVPVVQEDGSQANTLSDINITVFYKGV